jgi:hypothetical protein
LFPPVLESGFAGQAVEAVINLDGVEMPREELQPLRRLQVLFIEDAVPPVFVIPAAGSDPGAK